MANPVLIVHGWSDTYQSFLPLKIWLNSKGYSAQQVFFGRYESMEDHITFDDLAVGLQTRFEEMQQEGKLPSLTPFSLDVIVHSTGGPVVRHWLNYYLTEICKGDLARCPIRCLTMLAPANFGSRLAAQGKSALAKLFRGGVAHGFQTGRRILEGLELGSPVLWRMAEDDIFSERSRYPCQPDRGPFIFVFSGTRTYGELKGLVARGANEDGSDGTIRASAASLNSIKLMVDYRQPDRPVIEAQRHANAPVAFRLVPGKNHSEIVPRDPADTGHPMFELIPKCLEVNGVTQYEELRQEFDQANERFYADERQKQDQERVHMYQQFVVHVRDEMENDVLDYRLDFHVVDHSIAGSTWSDDREMLEKLQQYQTYTHFLQEQVIADVQPHSVNPSYRTFFINLDRLGELQAELEKNARKPYIAMNLDASGPTPDLTYDTDKLHYLPVQFPVRDTGGGRVDFFKGNTSTLVEIVLEGVPGRRVVELVWG